MFKGIISWSAFCLQVLEEDGCQETSATVGTYLLKELEKLRTDFSIVGDVRGKGLMVGVEMVADKVTTKRAQHNTDINGKDSMCPVDKKNA